MRAMLRVTQPAFLPTGPCASCNIRVRYLDRWLRGWNTSFVSAPGNGANKRFVRGLVWFLVGFGRCGWIVCGFLCLVCWRSTWEVEMRTMPLKSLDMEYGACRMWHRLPCMIGDAERLFVKSELVWIRIVRGGPKPIE